MLLSLSGAGTAFEPSVLGLRAYWSTIVLLGLTHRYEHPLFQIEIILIVKALFKISMTCLMFERNNNKSWIQKSILSVSLLSIAFLLCYGEGSIFILLCWVWLCSVLICLAFRIWCDSDLHNPAQINISLWKKLQIHFIFKQRVCYCVSEK